VSEVTEHYKTRDFWIRESVLYEEPSFRLRKCARLLDELTRGEERDLLDLGCGPAALRRCLKPNVNYHGVDIAIHEPAPYLLERDCVANPIAFADKKFDIVVALGVFEYMGRHQLQKFVEISRILKEDGTFIMSYINFKHVRRVVYPIYNNVQSIDEVVRSLEHVFRVEKCVPVSHHWRHKQPGRNALPGIQMRLNWNIPYLSSWLAVEYFCVCSRRT
jgi:SAM-dependent methyltransferase